MQTESDRRVKPAEASRAHVVLPAGGFSVSVCGGIRALSSAHLPTGGAGGAPLIMAEGGQTDRQTVSHTDIFN